MRFMRCFGEGGFDMEIGTHLLANYAEVVAVALFGIGFTNLLLQKNMIKKIIGLNIMDTAVYLFLANQWGIPDKRDM